MNDDIKLQIGDFYFTWDDKKAYSNELKHDVAFDMAAEVFFDKNAIEEPDCTTDEDSRRIIGKAMFLASPVLFVVFVERYSVDDRQIIRLISARKATENEGDVMSTVDRFELLRRLEAMTDDDIDFSDIPEVTDFSNWRPARDHFRAIAEANYRWRQEKTRQLNEQQAKQNTK